MAMTAEPRRDSWPDRYPPPIVDPARAAALADAYDSFRNSLCLRDLSPEKRLRIWNWIKTNDLVTLAFVRSPDYRIARDVFGAALVLPRETIDRALKATP